MVYHIIMKGYSPLVTTDKYMAQAAYGLFKQRFFNEDIDIEVYDNNGIMIAMEANRIKNIL